jgi:hypothetical protein
MPQDTAHNMEDQNTADEMQSVAKNMEDQNTADEMQSVAKNIAEKRTQMVYEIARLMAKAVSCTETKLWNLWESGTSSGVKEALVAIDWDGAIDKALVKKILKHKKESRELLQKPEVLPIIANILENYFNTMFAKMKAGERIAELESICGIFGFSQTTILNIWANQTAKLHLCFTRMQLDIKSEQRYSRSVKTMLNKMLNSRFTYLESEIQKIGHEWDDDELLKRQGDGGKPFEFNVIVEKDLDKKE